MTEIISKEGFNNHGEHPYQVMRLLARYSENNNLTVWQPKMTFLQIEAKVGRTYIYVGTSSYHGWKYSAFTSTQKLEYNELNGFFSSSENFREKLSIFDVNGNSFYDWFAQNYENF